MTNEFCQPLIVRWSDLDPNGHVRHSVYYDWAALARISYLNQRGVGIRWMAENAVGPVLFREEARFLREVHMGDELSVDFQVAGVSEDGRKWRVRHAVKRAQAEVVATVEVDGAWLDLQARKIRVPPADLAAALGELPKTADFAIIESAKRPTS